MTSHRPAVAEDRWIEFVRWPYEDEAWHVTVRAADEQALGFDLGSAGDPLRTRSAAFVISCDVASLNRLGVALALWVENSATPIREYLYSS